MIKVPGAYVHRICAGCFIYLEVYRSGNYRPFPPSYHQSFRVSGFAINRSQGSVIVCVEELLFAKGIQFRYSANPAGCCCPLCTAGSDGIHIAQRVDAHGKAGVGQCPCQNLGIIGRECISAAIPAAHCRRQRTGHTFAVLHWDNSQRNRFRRLCPCRRSVPCRPAG